MQPEIVRQRPARLDPDTLPWLALLAMASAGFFSSLLTWLMIEIRQVRRMQLQSSPNARTRLFREGIG
jgi:hypothetical protein